MPPALAPEESRRTFKLAEGLTISLVASEPTVRQPVTMTFDDSGRPWVLQYVQYPTPNGLTALEADQ